MFKITPQKTSPVQSPEPIAVDSAQAARMLSISPRTLHQLTKDGAIRAKRIGRKLIYSLEELRRFASGQ